MTLTHVLSMLVDRWYLVVLFLLIGFFSNWRKHDDFGWK